MYVSNLFLDRQLSHAYNNIHSRLSILRFRYNDEKAQDITALNKEFLNNHAPYQLLL